MTSGYGDCANESMDKREPGDAIATRLSLIAPQKGRKGPPSQGAMAHAWGGQATCIVSRCHSGQEGGCTNPCGEGWMGHAGCQAECSRRGPPEATRGSVGGAGIQGVCPVTGTLGGVAVAPRRRMASIVSAIASWSR